MKKWHAAVLMVLAGTLTAAPAHAQIGAPVYATSSTVSVRFAGASAGGVSDLYWFLTPGSATRQFLLTNGGSAVGDVVTINHTFNVGDEVVFGFDDFRSGSFFYSGPSSRNADGFAHMAVNPLVDPTFTIRAGWEDLFGGGDQDYDDLLFDFGGVSATQPPPTTTTPEPATLALLVPGVMALAFVRRRRRVS